MKVCAVITCKYCLEGHDGEPEGIAFHPFPKDKEVRAKWVDMTGRDFEPSKTDYICSRHFRESDYTVKRSGKKYLKTSAIPCEYVVYPTSIFVDSESSEESNEAAVKEEPPEILEGASRAEDIFFDEPTTSPTRDEPDSTCETWEPFLPGHHFSLLPPYLLGREAEVGSSGERDVGSAINPYPGVDLGPHLQQLPLPRTPEPPISYDEDTQDAIGVSPRSKLETIRKIVYKRKSSKKLIAAALAVVDEAKSLKLKLQTGAMNDHDKATAVIALQNKQIAKLTVLYKRQRKKLKKISAVLREVPHPVLRISQYYEDFQITSAMSSYVVFENDPEFFFTMNIIMIINRWQGKEGPLRERFVQSRGTGTGSLYDNSRLTTD